MLVRTDHLLIILFSSLLQGPLTAFAQPITTAGVPARLLIRQAGAHSIRITLGPLTDSIDLPFNQALNDFRYPAPELSLTSLPTSVRKQVGDLLVEVTPSPLTINVSTKDGMPIQRLVFGDSTVSFLLDDAPVLGLGEGGPKPSRGSDWRKAPIEFDRRGRLLHMQPRWQGDAYGSRNPVPLLIGTKGWALFVASPLGGDRSA